MRLASLEQWDNGTGNRWWIRLQDSGSSNLYRIDTGLAVNGVIHGFIPTPISLAFSPNGQYIAFAIFILPPYVGTTVYDAVIQCYNLGAVLGSSGTIDAGQLIFTSNATRTMNLTVYFTDSVFATDLYEAVPDDGGGVFGIESASSLGLPPYKINYVEFTTTARTIISQVYTSTFVQTHSLMDPSNGTHMALNVINTAPTVQTMDLSILASDPAGFLVHIFASYTGRTSTNSTWPDYNSIGVPAHFFDYSLAARIAILYSFSPIPSNFSDPILCMKGGRGMVLDDIWEVLPVTLSGSTLSGGSPITGISPSAPDGTPDTQFRAIPATDQPLKYSFSATPPPIFLPFMYIPQGQGQTVDELSGSSSISEHEIHCIDPSGDLKAMLASLTDPVLGTQATFALGFPGMNLVDFVPMSILQVIKAGWTNSGQVTFNMQDFQRFAKEYIWSEGGPSPWLPGDPVPAAPLRASSASNGQSVFDGNPRYLQGNPIDLLLVALQNELGIGQPTPNSVTWQLFTPGNDSTLINPNPYIDVPGLLALRDGQLSGDWVEFVIKAQETGKNWIEDQILKPYGLYTIILSTGQLTLKSMKSPPTTSPATWTDTSIMGIPAMDRWDIVNVVQVRLNVNDSETTTAARTYNSEIEYRDATSIQQFMQEMIQQDELTGLRTRRGGTARAFILSDRIFRRHAGGTPIYECEVQLRNLQPELGDYILLTHRLLLDMKTGLIGVTSVLCEVVDRQPDYSSGKLTYKIIDTRFVQETVAWEIAPNGTADWTSGGSGTPYLFICGDNGLMSDGVAGRTIF